MIQTLNCFNFTILDFSFKNNTSFVTRFNTLRRGRSTMHSPASHASSNKLQPVNASTDNLSTNGDQAAAGASAGQGHNHELTRDNSETRLGGGKNKSSDGESAGSFMLLVAY